MITGTVVVDLRRNEETADRGAAGSLCGLPDGVRVIFQVGDRSFAPVFTADWLREHVDRVHYDVHGTARAVQAWLEALRAPTQFRPWSA